MTREKFDEFYSEVIQPCIDGIIKNAKSEIVDYKCLSLRNKIDDTIYRNYQAKRDYIKYNYMSRKTPVALDRHKVASCMVYAILKADPFKIDKRVANLPEKVILANEYLSFFIALNIIEMYKLDELSGLEDSSKEYQIIIPTTYLEKDNPENTYESNLCKAWHYVKIDDIEKFDTLGYANIFFLLQKYTDIYMELKKRKKN